VAGRAAADFSRCCLTLGLLVLGKGSRVTLGASTDISAKNTSKHWKVWKCQTIAVSQVLAVWCITPSPLSCAGVSHPHTLPALVCLRCLSLLVSHWLAHGQDDLFSLPAAPGKTLVVGASYVALECAGFLTGLNQDTTVMMRSIPLRGFDQQCAEQICAYMQESGTKFIRGAIPASIEKAASGKIKVSWKSSTAEGGMASDEYDTVLLAIGRYALTEQCNVAAAGVKVSSSKKIEGTGIGAGSHEQSNVPHIFAIGDVLEGRPELTPVAVQAGIMLARRLYGGGTAAMDYDLVPTAVFSPLEYGCVGLSEEDCIAQYGEDKIDVYHQQFKPLELTLPGRGDNASYVKVIVDKTDSERILGMHYLGWNAGEVIQGLHPSVLIASLIS